MKNITIIDYDVGNLLSLRMSLEHLGAKVTISREREIIENSSHIILPGVGAFSNAMEAIKKLNLDQPLIEAKNKGSYILGICLGMQLLLNESEEFGLTKGLGFIQGKVIKISSNYKNRIKIPNIGWFNLYSEKDVEMNKRLFKDIIEKDTFYFVHSFMVEADNKKNSKYFIDFSGTKIPAVIMDKNIFGFQFHPEKSGKSGLKLLKNFIELPSTIE